MQRLLNHRQIEAFRAVMLSGGMTGAARLMNISQPAVTRLIRDFETDLGLTLFRRSGARIAPTAEGHRLYREVERHFVGCDQIREAARAIRETGAGHLHVGAMLTLSTGCLPAAVQEFLKGHPNVTLSIHSDSSLHIVDMVARGQLDVGLATVPADRQDIDHDRFDPVDAVAVLPQGHPLARKRVIDARDLHGESFISLGTSSILRLQIEEAFRAAGAQPRVRLSTLYSSTVAGYVAQGLGIGVTDPFAVLGADRSKVVVRPFRPRVPFPFSAVYRAADQRSHLAADFTSIVRGMVTATAKSLRN